MTVPSREKFARRCAEAWWPHETDVAGVNARVMTEKLDRLARAGIEVVMGYDHTGCCNGTEETALVEAFQVDGEWYTRDVPCPAGRPVFWEADA